MCDDEQWNSSIARDKKNVRYRWNFIDETICQKISFLKWTIEKKKKNYFQNEYVRIPSIDSIRRIECIESDRIPNKNIRELKINLAATLNNFSLIFKKSKNCFKKLQRTLSTRIDLFFNLFSTARHRRGEFFEKGEQIKGEGTKREIVGDHGVCYRIPVVNFRNDGGQAIAANYTENDRFGRREENYEQHRMRKHALCPRSNFSPRYRQRIERAHTHTHARTRTVWKGISAYNGVALDFYANAAKYLEN